MNCIHLKNGIIVIMDKTTLEDVLKTTTDEDDIEAITQYFKNKICKTTQVSTQQPPCTQQKTSKEK